MPSPLDHLTKPASGRQRAKLVFFQWNDDEEDGQQICPAFDALTKPGFLPQQQQSRGTPWGFKKAIELATLTGLVCLPRKGGARKPSTPFRS